MTSQLNQKAKSESQRMKTIYHSAELYFKPGVSNKDRRDVLKALKLATECTWRKVKNKYVSSEFSIMSNLKPPVLFTIIKEYRSFILGFKFKMHHVDAMPNRMITLTNNKLKYIK
jgi:hypothetical protein